MFSSCATRLRPCAPIPISLPVESPASTPAATLSPYRIPLPNNGNPLATLPVSSAMLFDFIIPDKLPLNTVNVSFNA